MPQADIIVRPSFTEGMPLSLIEAMASGVCVVASNIGGNSDLVRSGANGMLFSAGDSVELAGVLRGLIEDPGLRARLATAGYQTAQTYSWDKCAAETARILRSVSGAESGVEALPT
jgi:glycosyltransferase involved in cell wall biosynthesis